MKIALVYPPFLNSIQTTVPDFVNDNEGFFQPLGILYLASYLKEHEKGCDILVVDAVAEGLNHLQVGQRLADFSPDVVGISCWTFSLIDSIKVAGEAKARVPKAHVCLGGPHATIYPEETASFKDVDFVITGDGERPFAELIRQLSGKRDFNLVPNLYHKTGGAVKKSPLAHVERDLDGLPFPDRKLVSMKNYHSIIDKGEIITTMITSRGCPFQCRFCLQQNTGWRYREIPGIIEEMRQCIDSGIKNFFIFDETFTVNKKRILDLCDEIIRRKMRINWSCRSRVDTIDGEIMDRMKAAGCSRISFGVESASDEVLKQLNKKISIARAKETFRTAKSKKLITLADFMIGCPGEDRKATSDTVKLALELDPDYVQFTLFTLFPATELYEEALAKGIVKTDVWLGYARQPGADFKPPIWNIYNEDEARELVVGAYKKFYLRISYIFKRLIKTGSADELGKYVRAGLGLIKALFDRRKGQ
ncbi:MAG: radical SAM protein [Candidatus Omnitrophica bacterium]|nr:radical SAM protein [Candidatus Omnitrophota bacterium]MDD5435934.1 radical SAM protein [Candidatus Omnitrophota bacterium]